MQLLYKAYACEKIEGGTYLLPGFPVEPGSREVKSGEKIKVELGNGDLLQTTALGTKVFTFEASVFEKLRIRGKTHMWYKAVQVPDDFSPTAVDFGVTVYLDN